MSEGHAAITPERFRLQIWFEDAGEPFVSWLDRYVPEGWRVVSVEYVYSHPTRRLVLMQREDA